MKIKNMQEAAIRKYIRSVLLEGRGDLLFISTFKEILRASRDDDVFEFYSIVVQNDMPKVKNGKKIDDIDWRSRPYWAQSGWGKKTVANGTKVVGGVFKKGPRLEKITEEIYNKLKEKHPEATKRHFGANPGLLYNFILALGIWAYSRGTDAAAGVQSGGAESFSQWGSSQETPWGFAPSFGSVSINTSDRRFDFNLGEAGLKRQFINRQIQGVNTTYAHEYRHAYQHLFVIPEQMKITTETPEEFRKKTKEFFDESEKQISILKNMQLPMGTKNIFSQLFSEEQKRVPTKGRKPWSPGRGFHVIIDARESTGRDKWQKKIAKIIGDGLMQMIRDDNVQSGRAKQMIISWDQTSSRRGSRRQDPEFRYEVDAAELSKIWPTAKKDHGICKNSRYSCFWRIPYRIVRDKSAQPKLNRGERLFYIVPGSEGVRTTVLDKDGDRKWAKREKPGDSSTKRSVKFSDMRGLDWNQSIENLTSNKRGTANTGQKWSDQPTEFDAEFTAQLAKFVEDFGSLSPTGLSDSKSMVFKRIIDTVIRDGYSDSSTRAIKYMISKDVDISRFLGRWGGASEENQEAYEKMKDQRLNAVTDKIIMWVEDNWPEDFDTTQFRSHEYMSDDLFRRFKKLGKKMVEDIT